MKRENDSPIKVVEYSDSTEEFSGITRKTIVVDERYRYLRKNPLWHLLAFFCYRVIMTPFAYLYCKLKFRYRVVGREALKKADKKGYFVYSNHTLMAGDAFFPSLVSFPKKVRVIVNADNVSVGATRWFIECCGALPLPTGLSGMRHFLEAVEHHAKKGCAIQVYPEAHIWPYYTGIRPFPTGGFVYPARLHLPVYVSTVTYQKRASRKTPAVTLYLDGPFFAPEGLPERKQAEDLRDRVFETMKQRAENSTYEAIRYVKKTDKEEPTA